MATPEFNPLSASSFPRLQSDNKPEGAVKTKKKKNDRTESENKIGASGQTALQQQDLKTHDTNTENSHHLRNVTNMTLCVLAIVKETKDSVQEESNENSLINELKVNVKNLNTIEQEKFEKTLREQLHKIGEFQTTFSSNNDLYQKEKDNIKNEVVRSHYENLRKSELESYRTIDSAYKQLLPIYQERINYLKREIALNGFETQLLNEAIIGNDSYFKNYRLTNLSLGERYGAEFRTWEIGNALENRKSKLGLKPEDKPDSSTIPPITLRSNVQTQIVTLSHKIDELKEMVTIHKHALINYKETLKKTVEDVFKSEEIPDVDLPKKSYLDQKQQLDELKSLIETLKPEMDKRNQELDDSIEREKIITGSAELLACQQEKSEIKNRWEKINYRYQEIEALLEQRKSYYKLLDKDLEKSEEVKLDKFSKESDEALDLLKRITACKESIILENEWENLAQLEKRKISYFRSLQEKESLETEKTTFAIKTLPNRLNVLKTSVFTYLEYIKTLQQDMASIGRHLEILTIESQKRGSWQVDPPAPKADPVSTGSSESKSFLGQFFSKDKS